MLKSMLPFISHRSAQVPTTTWTKRQKRVLQSIPAKKYAAWRVANKPPRINERRLKRQKNKAWKAFQKNLNIRRRVQTHDPSSASCIAWNYFHEKWREGQRL